jgi:hypothetical protein
VDSKLKAWILEVNDHPSLNIYFDKEFMSHRVMTEDDVCPLDLYVKSRVVLDTIKLSKSSKFEPESLQQIYPTDNPLTSIL